MNAELEALDHQAIYADRMRTRTSVVVYSYTEHLCMLPEQEKHLLGLAETQAALCLYRNMRAICSMSLLSLEALHHDAHSLCS